MAYPLLYGAAASLLHMRELEEALTFLPSTIETDGFSNRDLNSIAKFVYGFHDILYTYSFDDFKILTYKFTNFVDGLDSKKNRGNKKSLPSWLSHALSSNESPDVKRKLDGLPPHLVPCLAYCALYPEGSVFVRETLVNHWIAQGFLGVIDEFSDLEGIGNECFDELLHRWGVFVQPTFVFGGPVYSCKLDPLVHQAARRIASNEVVILPDANHGSAAAAPAATAWHIASHKESSSTPSQQHQWHPHTYMCFTPQISHQVGLQRLRVLDMAGTQFKELPTIDPSQLLRYLGLSRNTLLEKLDLSRFPNLRTAAFDGCVHLKTIDSTISMPKLRHLYYTSKASSMSIDAPLLRILQVSHCPLLTSLSFHCLRLRRLRIFECPMLVSLPDPEEKSLQKAEELIFHNCLRLNLNSNWPFFPCSRYMEIIGLPKLKWLPEVQSTLHYLMIADCISLRSMDNILKDLKSLQKLRIYSCRNLSITPSVFRSLTGLKSLDIRKCPNITATDIAPLPSRIPDIIIDGQRPSFNQLPGIGKSAFMRRLMVISYSSLFLLLALTCLTYLITRINISLKVPSTSPTPSFVNISSSSLATSPVLPRVLPIAVLCRQGLMWYGVVGAGTLLHRV